MRMFRKNRAIMSVLLSAAFFLFIFALPLTAGHDIGFHAARITNISRELALGHFPVRIYSDYANGYGMAAPLFYGDIFLYLPAVLLLLGCGINTAYRFYIALCVTLMALSAFFSFKIVLKRKSAAFAAMLIYISSQYLIEDIFIRQALGEYTAFVFMPMVFAGLFDIVNNEGTHKWLLYIGYSGLILSHILTAILILPALVLFLILFSCGKNRDYRRIIKQLLFCVAVTSAISAWFILPLIEQMAGSKFLATDGTTANLYGPLNDTAVQSITDLFNFNIFRVFRDYHHMGVNWSPAAGIVFPIACAIWVVVCIMRRKRPAKKEVFYFLCVVFYLLLSTKYFPWKNLQHTFSIIQFPWRFLAPASLFTALFAGGIVTVAIEGRRISDSERRVRTLFGLSVLLLIICALSAVVLVPFLPASAKSKLPDNEQTSELSKTSKNYDYLPSGTDLTKMLSEREIILNADGTADFPYFYYKGYSAGLTENPAVRLPVSIGQNNSVRVSLEGNLPESIEIVYSGTIIQHISLVFSLAAAILLFAKFLLRKRVRFLSSFS